MQNGKCNFAICIGKRASLYLDDENNGFSVFQEMEDNEQKINAWDCVIDAIAYISKEIYKSNQQSEI